MNRSTPACRGCPIRLAEEDHVPRKGEVLLKTMSFDKLCDEDYPTLIGGDFYLVVSEWVSSQELGLLSSIRPGQHSNDNYTR